MIKIECLDSTLLGRCSVVKWLNVLLKVWTLMGQPDVSGLIEAPPDYSFGTTGETGHVYSGIRW